MTQLQREKIIDGMQGHMTMKYSLNDQSWAASGTSGSSCKILRH
jgi:hypothetical protein